MIIIILLKMKDFFTPTKFKTDKLFRLLNGSLKLSDIKYLSVVGRIINRYPNNAYRLINLITQKYKIEPIKYGYWSSGMMIRNDIKIINGKCIIRVKYNGL